jgi:tetratricopeptide (TPR) repeat protein
MKRALGILAGAALAVACKRGVAPPEAVDRPTVEAARAFATKFEAAMNPCDAAAVTELLDLEAIARKALQRVDAPTSVERQMVQEIRGSASELLCRGLAEGATYKLLRVRDDGGPVRAVYRLAWTDGMNYHELELGASKRDGTTRANDVYVYLSGERLSETLGDVFAALIDQGPTAIGRSSDVIDDVRRRLDAGDAAGAHASYRTLPDGLRARKAARLLGVEIASHLSDDEYRRVLEDYERDFPADPSLDLVTIDTAFLRKDWRSAIDRLDRLDRRVGGDPHLATLRATALAELGDTAEAIRQARAAVDADPDYEDGWWSLLQIHLGGADHGGAVATLDALIQRFEVALDEDQMRADPMWRGLLSSAEYAAWIKTRR